MTTPQDELTIIGPGAHVKGEMTFERGARILGAFEGRIVAAGEIHIGESAACKASITGSVVRIDGEVEGDVTAREVVHLGPTARMTGDLVAARLVVAEGASFLGHCRIGPDAVSGNAVPRSATPPVRPAHPTTPVRPRGADIETRPVEVARARLAEAQERLTKLSARSPSVSAFDRGGGGLGPMADGAAA
jgi:cytoskeletal protein CcmA (bactofilin family)